MLYYFHGCEGVQRPSKMPIGRTPSRSQLPDERPKQPVIEPRQERSASNQPPAKQIHWELRTPAYCLDDLILNEQTRNQLLDIVSYYKNHDLLFHSWGLEERFSQQDGLAVNLYGDPGTGKTMAAHAIAKELDLPMICVDYAEIESKYVGETSKNLTNLFQISTEHNALIFFDEADALLSKRVTNMTSATDVSVNQTRSVLLNLLNSYRGAILFATNFIQNFDAAFLRRIKFHVPFFLPDAALRERLWRMYIPQRMPCTANCAALAEKFDGVSGSDISNAVFTAAIQAARHGETKVTQAHLEQAIQNSIDVKKANQSSQIQVTQRLLTQDEARRVGLEDK